jgi:hypothetical protein
MIEFNSSARLSQVLFPHSISGVAKLVKSLGDFMDLPQRKDLSQPEA